MLLICLQEFNFNNYFQEKKKTKLENKDKPKQIPKTIENCRVVDETYVNDINNDAELQLDLRTDELSKHFTQKAIKNEDESTARAIENIDEDDDDQAENEDDDLDEDRQKIEEMENEYDEDDESDDEEAMKEPKILITTHEMRIHFQTYKLCRELTRVLPNAHYFYRKNTRLTKIIPEAIKRDYSAMIVINEDRKIPSKF